MGILLIMI